MYFYEKKTKKMKFTIELNTIIFYAYHGISLHEAKEVNCFLIETPTLFTKKRPV